MGLSSAITAILGLIMGIRTALCLMSGIGGSNSAIYQVQDSHHGPLCHIEYRMAKPVSMEFVRLNLYMHFEIKLHQFSVLYLVVVTDFQAIDIPIGFLLKNIKQVLVCKSRN